MLSRSLSLPTRLLHLTFKKLAIATRTLAKLYESVDTVERLAPQYFRVAYIGVGFPQLFEK